MRSSAASCWRIPGGGGQGLPPGGPRPRRHRRPRHRKAEPAAALLQEGIERARRAAGQLYAQDRWSRALHLPGDGRRRARTAPSSTSCPASTRRAARSLASRRPATEELDHDFLWRSHARCRSAAGSASSTAPTTRKCWSSACTPRSWQAEAAAELVTQADLGRALRGHRRLRALPGAQRHGDPEVLPHVSKEEQRRASSSASRSRRRTGSSAPATSPSAQLLGRIHGGLRERDPRTPPRPQRPGTWCRPTTSGSPGWWWPRPWRWRWRSSTCLPEGDGRGDEPGWKPRGRSWDMTTRKLTTGRRRRLTPAAAIAIQGP